jgi:acetamidase/formamidase
MTQASARPLRAPGTGAHRAFGSALLLVGACVMSAQSAAAADPATAAQVADHHVRATPENVTWGDFPLDKAPVLRMRSGATVRIDTLTHAGATQQQEPISYLGALGIAAEDIPQEALDFWASREGRPREGRSGHIITGPIYVEGAAPGDVLEIEVLSLETTANWGINNTAAQSGVFSAAYPGSRDGDEALEIAPGTRHVIRTAVERGREVALFSPEIRIPLAPFMGIMAVAPRNPMVGEPGVTVPGVQSSRPPGPFGGNLDVNDLGVGTSLFLPVFHEGALFYTGDPHGVQGDGEVSGTALEQSLSGVFRITVHKDRSLAGPRAESATHWILMGIDLDLDRALQKAVREVIDFLVEEKGLSQAKAYSLASMAVDFEVGEAVDLTQVVTGHVPKALFETR